MPTLFPASWESRYRDRPFLVLAKAKILHHVLVLCLFVLGAKIAADLLRDPSPGAWYLATNALLLCTLGAGFLGLRSGHYESTANLVVATLVAIVCLSAIPTGLGGEPERFLAGRARYLPPLLLSAVLFGSRPVVLASWTLSSATVLAYPWLFCGDLEPRLREDCLTGAIETVAAGTLVALVALAHQALVGQAIRRTDGELERNRALRDELESRVAERTRDLDEALHRVEEASSAKTRFLANMSHEIRTPLNAMLGMADVLRLSAPEERTRNQAGLILDSGRHLLALVQDILDTSKIESGYIELERSPFRLPRELERVAELMAPQASAKGLEFSWECAADLDAPLLGDATRLRQVAMNLLGNAVKFTPSGFVRLRAERFEAPGRRIGVRLSVRDSGIGIPDSQRERIFQPFLQGDSTTSRRFGGTGLGLTIARELALRMGGSLGFESRPGVGTEFVADFAFETAVPAPPAPEETSLDLGAVVGTLRRRALLVDDTAANRQVVAEMLELLGVPFAEAENGLVALSLLEREPFDLVLMDLHMPVLDGLSTFQRLLDWKDSPEPARRTAAATPVVALSADVHGETIETCLRLGMQGHLSKPFLLRDLRRLLERHGLIERKPTPAT